MIPAFYINKRAPKQWKHEKRRGMFGQKHERDIQGVKMGVVRGKADSVGWVR